MSDYNQRWMEEYHKCKSRNRHDEQQRQRSDIQKESDKILLERLKNEGYNPFLRW